MYECEFRGFTARCKPLDEPKDKKARLDFARNKVLSPFFFQILWTNESRIND